MHLPVSPQVAVQFFGDYSRMRVPVSSLIPTQVALKQRLWLPTVVNTSTKAEWIKMVKIYRIGLRECITYCKVGGAWTAVHMCAQVNDSGQPQAGLVTAGGQQLATGGLCITVVCGGLCHSVVGVPISLWCWKNIGDCLPRCRCCCCCCCVTLPVWGSA